MSHTFYKTLGRNATASHGGRGAWFKPSGKWPGKWMPAIANPVPCERGYHLCRDETDLLAWLAPEIWVAEYRGQIVEAKNKVCVEQARLVRKTAWDERTASLFAADCAEHVLPLFEQEYPNDDRPRLAIAAARQYANGEITIATLAAAGAAAWIAAWDAAGAAAGAATLAAAWIAAAWIAAGAAAWIAAWDASGAAEREWQAERLRYYLNTEQLDRSEP